MNQLTDVVAPSVGCHVILPLISPSEALELFLSFTRLPSRSLSYSTKSLRTLNPSFCFQVTLRLPTCLLNVSLSRYPSITHPVFNWRQFWSLAGFRSCTATHRLVFHSRDISLLFSVAFSHNCLNQSLNSHSNQSLMVLLNLSLSLATDLFLNLSLIHWLTPPVFFSVSSFPGTSVKSCIHCSK